MSYEPFISDNAKQVVLDKMRVAAMAQAPGALVRDSLVADSFYERSFDQVAFRLMAYVLGEQVGAHEHEVTFRSPASWWQHLKNDIYNLVCSHFPRPGSWLLHHSPVKYRVEKRKIHETVNATYPYANISVPDLGDRVVFSVWDGPSRLEDFDG